MRASIDDITSATRGLIGGTAHDVAGAGPEDWKSSNVGELALFDAHDAETRVALHTPTSASAFHPAGEHFVDALTIASLRAQRGLADTTQGVFHDATTGFHVATLTDRGGAAVHFEGPGASRVARFGLYPGHNPGLVAVVGPRTSMDDRPAAIRRDDGQLTDLATLDGHRFLLSDTARRTASRLGLSVAQPAHGDTAAGAALVEPRSHGVLAARSREDGPVAVGDWQPPSTKSAFDPDGYVVHTGGRAGLRIDSEHAQTFTGENALADARRAVHAQMRRSGSRVWGYFHTGTPDEVIAAPLGSYHPDQRIWGGDLASQENATPLARLDGLELREDFRSDLVGIEDASLGWYPTDRRSNLERLDQLETKLPQQSGKAAQTYRRSQDDLDKVAAKLRQRIDLRRDVYHLQRRHGQALHQRDRALAAVLSTQLGDRGRAGSNPDAWALQTMVGSYRSWDGWHREAAVLANTTAAFTLIEGDRSTALAETMGHARSHGQYELLFRDDEGRFWIHAAGRSMSGFDQQEIGMRHGRSLHPDVVAIVDPQGRVIQYPQNQANFPRIP